METARSRQGPRPRALGIDQHRESRGGTMMTARRRATYGWLVVAELLFALISLSVNPIAQSQPERAAGRDSSIYRPKLAVPDTMAPFLKHLEPGNDVFALERQNTEIEVRLGQLSAALRGGSSKVAATTQTLLA